MKEWILSVTDRIGILCRGKSVETEVGKQTQYHLPEGYRENPHPDPYVATVEKSNWYQVEVYRLSALLINLMGMGQTRQRILDLGCGLGTKLKEFIVHLQTVGSVLGVDLDPPSFSSVHGLRSCRFDLDLPSSERDLSVDPEFDMIICSDVIEHVQHPLNLLSHIKESLRDEALAVISTPCRDARGVGASGPPNNRFHVREWSGPEFYELLTEFGFEVLSFPLLAEGRDPMGAKTCQTAVVKRK